MGMDVYGKAPDSTEGEYFRNSVWWWRPLADFIIEYYPGIAAKCQSWHSNDGDGLEAEDAKVLGWALQASIDSGFVAAYALEYKAKLEALPNEECRLCGGTGARTDEIGVRHGLDKPGGCNGCGGKGFVRPWADNYPFSEENVQEFATFCIHSGGFEIC